MTGRISIYDPDLILNSITREKELKLQGTQDSGSYILSNHYWPGQSVCDPEQNQSATYFSRVIVTS